MAEIRLIETEDRSHSLYVPELNETYHSFHGAIQESQHVFIREGLHYYFNRQQTRSIKILEIGFGTGLNALLTYKYFIKRNVKIKYNTIEPFPIGKAIWSKLNYVELLNITKGKEVYKQMHTTVWNTEKEVVEGYLFTKFDDKLENASLRYNYYDIVFFDAFAPSKQPGMWKLFLLEKITQSIKPGGVFVTYCAQGQFKRNLKSTGLNVETLPGPPGKKEMVRGIKH